jgi:hypothetical protein
MLELMHQRVDLPAMRPSRPDSPASDTDSVFTDGFQSPWQRSQAPAVPWSQVQELLAMAQDALTAKQRVAEASMDVMVYLMAQLQS